MGFTALCYAAVKGHSEIVKMLLVAGAATDIRDKVWHTSLNSDHDIHSYCMELSLSCVTL